MAVAAVSNTCSAANEVGFTTKLSTLFSQIFMLYSVIDERFGLSSGIYALIDQLYSMFSLVLFRYDLTVSVWIILLTCCAGFRTLIWMRRCHIEKNKLDLLICTLETEEKNLTLIKHVILISKLISRLLILLYYSTTAWLNFAIKLICNVSIHILKLACEF